MIEKKQGWTSNVSDKGEKARIEGAKESCRKKRAIMEVIVIDWHLSSGYVPSCPHSHSTSLTYTPLIITPPHSQYL